MKKILLLIAFFCIINSSFAQENTTTFKLDNDRNLWQKFTYDMGNVFGGMGYAYTRPLHWEKKQWNNFLYVAGGTTALTLVDESVDRWADNWRGDVPRWLADYGNEYGSPNNNYLITGAVYLTGLFTDNPK
jgi:hypothetical protein